MTIADQLKEMGFDAIKVEMAMRETGGSSLEQAMEWILAHNEDEKRQQPGPSSNLKTESAGPAQAELSTADEGPVPEDQRTVQGQEARSMKCDDCGKLFPNEDALVWHASKSGHTNFSESQEAIKPKTPEELKAAKDALEARIKANRLIRLEKERQEEHERERLRRAQGREIVELRQKFKEDEIKREAEARRREKQEGAAARRKILEEIERDKEERRKKLQQPATGGAAQNIPVMPATPKPAATTGPAKEYNECRIHIRLTNGQTLTQTFKSCEQLAAVRCYIMTNRLDGDVPFQLMTSFPKKIFTEEDMTRTLKELSLVPSAVLILSKITQPSQ
ncbi:UBX domain-containing protein 1-like isoform X1 [Varroa destructor]|uniref:UBX domain-containing protein 1 n=1 Tax=Varroa destructor TaxID=109461 RepID=A0A7M7KWB1_VARDE|nr:UBX domain-containing protein 1-like isoform X1 [Varroa destructor]XP_022669872.1 UBX domain-containing protein 1-like isoform X1 [Varroa destructor]XP_022669873.1 UBX domain-containing protein 1-like isoform X1 [Varroa destructor]